MFTYFIKKIQKSENINCNFWIATTFEAEKVKIKLKQADINYINIYITPIISITVEKH